MTIPAFLGHTLFQLVFQTVQNIFEAFEIVQKEHAITSISGDLQKLSLSNFERDSNSEHGDTLVACPIRRREHIVLSQSISQDDDNVWYVWSITLNRDVSKDFYIVCQVPFDYSKLISMP